MDFNTHIKFSKYHGTGNDFIILYNGDYQIPELNSEQIKKLCSRRFGIGADGLIIIKRSPIQDIDFTMQYYNSDGNESTMCGNGGRCSVAHARKCGLFQGNQTTFQAIDGLHSASFFGENIQLQMNNSKRPQRIETNFYFVDTGSPHVVIEVEDLESIDVDSRGRLIRNDPRFVYHGGTNVNFYSNNHEGIRVRTYERGVETETYSCGTGVTAVMLTLMEHRSVLHDRILLKTRGGDLTVSAQKDEGGYSHIFLIGPTAHVYDGQIML